MEADISELADDEGALSDEEKREREAAILAEILEIDESRITRESRFTEDLDADSLALIELVEVLEEEIGERTVGFSVDDEDLDDLHTVGDAVDYVIARLERAGS